MIGASQMNSFFFIVIFTSPLAFASLDSFFASLPIESQTLLLWNTTAASSPCQWKGVTCSSSSSSSSSSQILSLNLSGFGLIGRVDTSIPHLCSLPYLKSLDLSDNNFTGSIPLQIFNCSILETVNLGGNFLTGSIPTPQIDIISSLKLKYLALYQNSLNDEIPNELFQIPNLEFLYLYSNNLTGNLPNCPPNCNLIHLLIYENNLSGNIPVSLGNCINLTILDASSNNFEGTLKNKTFYNLIKLELLYLYQNRLSGEIPNTIGNLVNLKEVFLYSNNFSGLIPEEIGYCKNLMMISLWGNKFIGNIPNSIGNLINLEYLILAQNLISGFLPNSIGKCQSLTKLQIQENNIIGFIPSEICELKNLQILYLYKNKLEGNIPREIWKMKNLVDLQLYNNSFSGKIPKEIILLRNLSYISLAFNNLSGEIPYYFGKNNYNGLISIDLTNNLLYGIIPPYLCSKNKLQILDLGQNRFNSVSIDSVVKCSSLTRVILSQNQINGNLNIEINPDLNSQISYFDISGNLFKGKIPKWIGLFKSLSTLDLSNNYFKGNIPSEFGNLTNIGTLNIASNKLAGSIPSQLGNLNKLLKLDLSNNQISGKIPENIIKLVNLQNLLLNNNKLNGQIPDLFTSNQGLLELELGNNLLEGSIPFSLGNLNYIYLTLNLSSNNLTGQIPSSLGNLDKLQILDLSNNKLNGQIPSNLNNMKSLSYVNISYNQLSGNIPSTWGKFVNSSPNSFFGNPKLNLNFNNNNPNEETNHKGKNKKKHMVIIIAIIITASILIMILCIAKYISLRNNKLSYSKFLSNKNSELSTNELPEDLSYNDIMKYTNNLSQKYIIGQGRHGKVYKTESKKGKKFAIKTIELTESNFCIEIRVLCSIKHRNLVKMEGFCIKENFGLIVCDFVPGGTLYDLIHKKENYCLVGLDWEIRFKICLGLANGLAYLHHDCVPMIVHRDVKSSNILMDLEFEPKLADFGLAKFIDGEDDNNNNNMSAIVGTLGYIAPENGYCTTINEKCDVYSFGVVLLELLCRRLPVDPSFGEGIDIVQWINSNFKNSNFEILNCLDEEIWYWSEDEKQKALKLLDLAVSCTQFEREKRPTMREVTNVLIKMER